MKKLKVFSVILLVTSIGAFVAFQGYTRMIQDKKPPVVSCDSSELKVSVKAKEKDLLKGVTAKDSRSGDVSDTLVVENMSEFTDKGKRTVTYAAVDKSMNVGRAERTLVYEDYKPPVFHMTGSLLCGGRDCRCVIKDYCGQCVGRRSYIKYQVFTGEDGQYAGCG